MTVGPDATSASAVSISLARISIPYAGIKLDKLKSNYKEWCEDITIALSLNSLYEYVTGDSSPPPESEARAFANWKANQRLAYAFLASSVAKSERPFLDMTKGPDVNWTSLQARHQKEGPVRQVQLLQQALSIQCTKDTPLPETAEQICTLIERAFAMGDIKADLLCSIALLNSLSDHFPHARSIISRDISNSTEKSPYTSNDIRRFLENEQSLIENDQRAEHKSSIALMTRPHAQKMSSPFLCSNPACKKTGHTVEFCIKQGGGMAGKSIEESKAARKLMLDKKRSGIAATKVPVTVKDVNGRAFTVLVDPDPLPSPPPHPEFAGLAHDPLPAASIEEIEYEGWMAVEEEPTTSIDWEHHTAPAAEAALTLTALNQTTRTQMSLNDFPFIVDTGASVHISPDRSDFLSLHSTTPRSVKGVGGSSIPAFGVGDIKVRVARGASVILRNTLYVPNATVRLISVSTLTADSNAVAHFDSSSCWITDKSTGAFIARGPLLPAKKLYALTLHSATADHALTIHGSPSLETWHRRLGHANYQSLWDMAKKGTLTGASVSSISRPPKCDACILGKQTKTPVPKKREEGDGHKATRKLEKVWVDLSGAHAVRSRTGNEYVMDIVDDYTSFPWSIPLKNKDDAFPELKAWELAREAETGLKVGTYITDNGELKSHQMNAWLKSRGTQQRFTAPHTSAHIGRVERMHRTLMAKARTMRIYAKLPTYLWDEFYLTSVHLHAKTTTRSLRGITPWELWHGRKPDYSYMREIGCRAFVLIPKKDNPKIFERSIECVLVGYEHKSKAYRCYNRTTHKIHSSYHVRFIESHEGHTPSGPDTLSDTPETDVVHPMDHIPIPSTDDEEDEDDPIPPSAHPDMPTLPPVTPPPRRSSRVTIPTERNPNGGPTTTRTKEAVQEAREGEARVKELRRERKAAKLAAGTSTDHSVDPTADNNVINDLRRAFEDLDLGDQAHELLAMISEMSDIDPESLQFEDEPRTWDEAKSSADADRWATGYRDELQSLKDMGVYKLIPRSEVPPGKRIRKGKPVFHIKRDEDGKAVRWKVRLVFKGFEQIYGKDYTKTTSPTARMESWRILLHIAASLDWDAQQIDVKTAFLYGLLPDDEVQYMQQPIGFEESGKEDWVWQLQRGLYGMKQSGRIWNQTLNAQMIDWGFTRLTCESCIYYRKTDTGIIISAVHVDDYLSIADSKGENERFKDQMRKVWTISELGTARFIMGIAISWDKTARTVALSQTALIDKIIEQFRQKDAHPVSAPFEPGCKLRRTNPQSITPEERSQLVKLPYRSLVGCLLYLAISTRPDISYAVQQLSQFLDSYSFEHWGAAIRLVRYLKGTRELKLYLGGDSPILLRACSDSDWANCLDTRRSVGGYVCSLGSGAISWAARKQKVVAASSCEAEYIAAFETAKECIWLRTLLEAIDHRQTNHTIISCDNTATKTLSEDPLLHSRVKHVDIKYHFLRERVQSGDLRLTYINTRENAADMFTKALDVKQFSYLRDFLGLR
jgi:hypothetical protein